MIGREQSQRIALAAVGFVQGVILWRLSEWGPRTPTIAALLTAAAVVTLVAGLTLQFAWTGERHARLIAIAAALAGVFGAIGWWVWIQVPEKTITYAGDAFRQGTFAPAAFLALYVLTPFLQIFQATGRARFPYVDLFRHSWNNVFIGTLAGLFTGLYWALIELWAALFDMLGIAWFKNVFHSDPFRFLTLATVFGFGIALAKENDAVIGTLRRITLAFFRILMPFLSLIALLFLATLPLTGLAPLWATKAASPLLLSLLILTIVFINAVFQDGSGERPYPTWLRRGVEVALLAMPIFAGLSLYSINLRVAQYGLMPERFYVVLVAVTVGLYGLGYATAVLWRGSEWLGLMRPVNLWMSLVVAAIALLLHTPVLDPLAWSAANQYRRLVDQRVPPAQFDFAALRFKLGAVGFETLQRLKTAAGHPQAEVVRTKVEDTERLTTYVAPDVPAMTLLAEHLQVVGLPEGVPGGLVDFLNKDALDFVVRACVSERDCVIFPIDVDGDSLPEYALLPSYFYSLYVFGRSPSGWRRVGEYESIGCGFSGARGRDDVVAAIRRGEITSPSVPAVAIAKWRFGPKNDCPPDP